MKEVTLLKIALTCSVFGIVLLFLISDRISVQEIDISKIEEEGIGKDVKVIGKVGRVTDTGKMMFLEVEQEKVEQVTIILFKPGDITLFEGEYVEIVGEVEDYKGKREIIANKVKKI